MPFCPECAFEYGSDILVCPECRVGLVNQLPTVGSPAAMQPDDSWVGVCRIGDTMTTRMICGLLDANNIPSMVTSSAFQPLLSGVGWVTNPKRKTVDKEVVMVPREFKDEAELLLSAILGDDYEVPDVPRP